MPLPLSYMFSMEILVLNFENICAPNLTRFLMWRVWGNIFEMFVIAFVLCPRTLQICLEGCVNSYVSSYKFFLKFTSKHTLCVTKKQY